ncbi:MAG TPA: ribosome-binding factor A [Phycisphaerae bacterium]|nr:ribosome-binding factor A [Phycisphaerae bacterium]
MGTHPSRGHRRAPQIGGPLRPLFDSPSSRNEKPDHKTAALCKQVHRALSLALAGECADPLLQSLLVDAVLPAPHAGHLLVRLLSPDASPADLLPRLELVTGLLRNAIAQSINRKRTPQLSFQILPLSPTPPTEEPLP